MVKKDITPKDLREMRKFIDNFVRETEAVKRASNP
jgi:hypothetical protein